METNYLVCSRWIKVEVGGDRRGEDLVEEEFELIERVEIHGGEGRAPLEQKLRHPRP